MPEKESLTLDELYDRYGKLIFYALRKYRGNCYPVFDYEDLCQEGFLILVDAYNRWTPNKCAFSTFACNHIYWRIKEYVHANEGKMKVPRNTDDANKYYSLDFMMESKNGDDDILIDLSGNDESWSSEIEIIALAENCSSTEKQFRLWFANKVLGLKISEIARNEHVTKQTVSSAIKKVNDRVKDALKEAGYGQRYER